MERLFSVLEVIVPIFTAVSLGMIARRRRSLSPEQVQGLQQFIIKFAIPCVLFNSCVGANFTTESIASIATVPPLMLLSTIWSFRARKKAFPYRNLPMLFCAQESGMLGIPLYMTLFGTAHMYRMGVLDLAQAFIAIPVISILAADTGSDSSVGDIIKSVFHSPLMLMGLLGIILSSTGAAAWLNSIGIGQIITASTGFMAQPVSAAMLFSVGYNFSLDHEHIQPILKLSVIHFVAFAIFGLIMQLILSVVSTPTPETRWAVLLYTLLPGSYLTPTLGRSEDEYTVSSGVCSLMTIVTLMIFCVMTIIVR